VIATTCQRWRERRDSYRPKGEPIDPSKYGVEVLDEPTAKAFVTRQLLEAGAPSRKPHESGAAWVKRCLLEAPWRRNHVYAWPLERGVELARPAQVPPCSRCGESHVPVAA
jgi:hypothetical protein